MLIPDIWTESICIERLDLFGCIVAARRVVSSVSNCEVLITDPFWIPLIDIETEEVFTPFDSMLAKSTYSLIFPGESDVFETRISMLFIFCPE
ncbi:hypothetical protein [Halorubrum sp. SS7]|uniref:hypothetical protein n=1 Tax=Halorubrum sp. SS7 TaxID=2518119 RepID=UPI0010F8C285|nr:hypothetical protein [Halorubrum sp. SS7]